MPFRDDCVFVIFEGIRAHQEEMRGCCLARLSPVQDFKSFVMARPNDDQWV